MNFGTSNYYCKDENAIRFYEQRLNGNKEEELNEEIDELSQDVEELRDEVDDLSDQVDYLVRQTYRAEETFKEIEELIENSDTLESKTIKDVLDKSEFQGRTYFSSRR